MADEKQFTIDPIELYIDRKVLDQFTMAVESLSRAMKQRGGDPPRIIAGGEVSRAFAIARTHAETAELWLQAAERIALGEWERSALASSPPLRGNPPL